MVLVPTTASLKGEPCQNMDYLGSKSKENDSVALLIFAVVLVKLIYCCCVVLVLVKRLVSSVGTGFDDGKPRTQVVSTFPALNCISRY